MFLKAFSEAPKYFVASLRREAFCETEKAYRTSGPKHNLTAQFLGLKSDEPTHKLGSNYFQPKTGPI